MSAALLERFARRDLRPEELLRLQEHLASCELCAQMARDRAGAARSELRRHFLADAPAPLEHPGPEALTRFAFHRLDAESSELVEGHLDECPECATIVDETRAYRRTRTRRRWILAAAAVLLMVVVASFLARRTAVRPGEVSPIVKQRPAPERGEPRAPQPPAPIATAYADPEWNALVRDATETGRLAIPADLAGLRGAEDIVRGSGNGVERGSPAGKVIDDPRPAFSWPSREGAAYTVFVFDGNREIARSATLHETHWAPRADLPRGRTLSWQVEAARGETIETIPRPPAPPARFRIITSSDDRALARARAEHPGDHLLLGVLYARAGMVDEARASLERAAATNPAARKLIESIPKG